MFNPANWNWEKERNNHLRYIVRLILLADVRNNAKYSENNKFYVNWKVKGHCMTLRNLIAELRQSKYQFPCWIVFICKQFVDNSMK